MDLSLARRGRGLEELATLALVLVFVLADNRLAILAPFEDLRYVLLLGLAALAVLRWLPLVDSHVVRIIPFTLVGLVASASSPTPLRAVLQAAAYPALLLVVFQHVRPLIFSRRGRLLLDLVTVCMGILVAGLLLALVLPQVAILYPNARLRGLFGNPNGLAMFAALTLPLVLVVFETLRPRAVLRRWIYVGIILLVLVLSGSRSALLAVMVYVPMYVTFRGSVNRRVVVVGLAAAVVLLMVTLVPFRLLLDPDTYTRLGPMADYLRVSSLEDGSGRWYAWRYALDVIREAPVLGRGFGYDEHIFASGVVRGDVFLGGHQGSTHNLYLALVLNTGVVGAALFLAFLWSLTGPRRASPHTIPLMAAVLVSSVFESWLVSTMNPLTLVFFLTLVAIDYQAAVKVRAAESGSPVRPGTARAARPARVGNAAGPAAA